MNLDYSHEIEKKKRGQENSKEKKEKYKQMKINI